MTHMSLNDHAGMTGPRVTVLMPAYNAAPFLRAAVDSVLAQTFSDFELVVVDDASTDETPVILASYTDPRIRVHRLASNGGVSQARNSGIARAQGEYLALLDADDIAYPERLEKQVIYLDSHPDVAAVGSLIDFTDENGRVIYRESANKPCTPEEVAKVLPWGCCFVPSSMMIRLKPLLKLGGYNGSDVAEDYDLILRLAEEHRLANIKEWLYAYRMHTDQASFTKIRKMRIETDATKLRSFQRRVARGQLPPAARPPLPSFWDKLRGRRYTLAGDYLSWAGSYYVLHQYRQSLRLSFKALLNAPFCSACYGNIFRAVLCIVLPPRYQNMLVWYGRKITGSNRRRAGNLGVRPENPESK